ncbi:hypothetical protein MTP10_37195 [Nonomuraea sp. 3-1Str]|uniref:hypothetical protein n=1 Tax=Nonomuraea sp. 3-1Str TaxID=2929801 RepID=UPI00285AFC60|nr:hypothetical protein [Nonomuraea sp. 3-1Str]MDR8414354.1 hypothetical protein [Nonomuraea sp. 3-1Str]
MLTTRTTIAAPVLAAAFVLITVPASAQAQSQAPAASACRQIVITGSNVGVREFAHNNAQVLQTRKTKSVLTSCQFVRGNGSNSYTPKCGASGRNWFQVNIKPTRDEVGFEVNKGYVPATCARVR